MAKIRASLNRSLKCTEVYDTYWRFAHLRQEIFLKRVAGHRPPWTDDSVLGQHRFTNVFRASDRVSQYLIREVAYAGDQDPRELFFRVVLFKLFNKIETWKHLVSELGEISWLDFDLVRYDEALDGQRRTGRPIYSAAYIMPSPRLGAESKHTNHLRLLDRMMRDELPLRVRDARSLKEVYELLSSYPSMGRFLAFQMAIDLNYSILTDFSEMDFVVAGPGASDGIRRCFADTGGLSDEEIIKVVTERATEEFASRGLSFLGLYGRCLQLVDCQNLFCEVEKYSRVVHPESAGRSGRTRIKQKFQPELRTLPQWYPPKWDLKVPNGTVAPNTRGRAQRQLFA